MNLILGGLNPAQQEAVETLSGPVLVLAGAGSGKTKVLTHRIANLIAHGTKPNEILAVTFTNKAAKEMRARLWRLLEEQRESASGRHDLKAAIPRSFMPYMGTFHGICVRILRIEYLAAGIDRNFTIYDSDDQLTLIRRIMRQMKLTGEKNLTPKIVHGQISNWQTAGLTPEEAKHEAIYPNQKHAADVFVHYELEKAAASALDFDDLLLKTAKLLRENAEVRTRWQEHFKHILIDEYQDTNAVQYRLIKSLVNVERNICVVGDDWQSIYSWRGADFTNILNFERDFQARKSLSWNRIIVALVTSLPLRNRLLTRTKLAPKKRFLRKQGRVARLRLRVLLMRAPKRIMLHAKSCG